MDKYKSHLQSYLQISLLVLLFLVGVSIEILSANTFSIYSLIIILIAQFIFTRNFRKKSGGSISDIPWIVLVLTVPFSSFLNDYNADTYFLVMSAISGVVVGFCLYSFCQWLASVLLNFEQHYLAGEAKMIGRCLVGLPLAFIGIMIYLIISVRGGVSTLSSVGDLVLVKHFPLIMMIGAAFPAILVARSLMVLFRREEND